jgi:DNA polymerase III delta' subunit
MRVKADLPPVHETAGRLRTRGHPAACAAIRRYIDTERAPHAILLSGPRGSGKTSLALDLASGLLCLADDPTERPCHSCAACHKVEHGNHPDLHRVVPEGAGEQIRLAQVQALVSELALLAMEGRVRVALIESANRLNPDAQNALLKTLEEPVGAACMVLCADETAPLLPTVISRTARHRLGWVPPAAIADLLAERGLADAARARALASAASGLPGLAVTLAARPEALLGQAQLARQLLDLLAADRRTRLGAVPALMSEAGALDAAYRVAAGEDSDTGAGALDSDPDPAATADGDPDRPMSAPSVAARRPAARSPASGPRGATPTKAAASRGPRRPEPAERRRAAQRILLTWREVGRDLAVVASGGRAGVRQLDLLEDLEKAAPLIDRVRLLRFLDRLDGLTAAIEAYASPELVLDDLLLAWPRPAVAAPAAVSARPA